MTMRVLEDAQRLMRRLQTGEFACASRRLWAGHGVAAQRGGDAASSSASTAGRLGSHRLIDRRSTPKDATSAFVVSPRFTSHKILALNLFAS